MEKVRFLVFRLSNFDIGVPATQVRRVLAAGDHNGRDVHSLAGALGVAESNRREFLLETFNEEVKWEVGWVSGVNTFPLENIYPIPKLLEKRLHPALQGAALIGDTGIVWLLDLDELHRRTAGVKEEAK